MPGALAICGRPCGHHACAALQVEWSLSGGSLMVVMSDTTVRVFDAATGAHTRTLAGHAAKIFELAAHPRHADVLATWGRDGAVVLWDTGTGRVLRRFDLAATYPGRGRWTGSQPLAALEGAWLPDGNTLCVTDAAGQVHVYGLGPGDARARARYDQFYKTDYMDLTIDPLTHTVRGMASGRQPHAERGGRAPISYDGTPYEEEYQRLAMANQLSRGALFRAVSVNFRVFLRVFGSERSVEVQASPCATGGAASSPRAWRRTRPSTRRRSSTFATAPA